MVSRVDRIVDGVPAVRAPMHRRRRERLDAEDSAFRHRSYLVVEPPDEMGRCHAVDDVSLNGLRRPVEHVCALEWTGTTSGTQRAPTRVGSLTLTGAR